MMRRIVCSVAAGLMLMVAAGCGDDGDVPAASEGVRASDVWARPTAVGVANASVYMLLESPTDDRLTSVTVGGDIAERVTLHETMTMSDHSSEAEHDHAAGTGDAEGHGDDMTSMRPLDAIELPGNSDVRLEPGGLHVMLENLAAPLTSGETFPIVLSFDSAGPLTVTVTVRDE